MIKLLHIIKLIFVINLFFTSNLYANESNDTESIEKQSYDEIVETLPYEYISFESSKKFIKSLKDILKDEIPNNKMDFTLKPYNVSDTGLNYKNIKTFKKALPLGSKEIIRSVKELNIEEGSELEKSLQKEIYQIALSRASGKSLNEIRKSSSKGKIGLGLLGVGAAIAVGGSSDSPAPVPSVSINTSTSTLAEDSSSNITVTATLNILQDKSTTINLTTSGTATVSSDYSISSKTITIDAGDKIGSVTVSSIDNSLYEGNETVIIDISDVTGSNIVEAGVQRKTITITDSLAAPTVTLSSSASSVAENGSDLTLTATLNRQTFEDVTVTLSGTGTSTAGTDYASLSTITISAGNTTGTTAFNPTDDSIYEGSETAIVAITGVSGGDATENGTQSETITITDNETAPTVTLSTSASSVAENGSDLTLTATLSGATSEDVTVTLTGTGTSTAGTDYASLSTITISAGNTTGTTAFNPTDDSIYEGSETAIIAITGVSGGSATESGTQSETITITDNETAPTVTLSTSASSVAENGSDLTITATLSVATTADVTVTLSGTGTSTAGTDYASLSTITISAGNTTGTTAFNPTNNSVYEGNETAIIAITGVSGGSATENGTQSQTITITDSFSAPTVTLSSSASSVAENGSDLTLTATLSVATTADVTVTLSGTGTSTAGTDYASLSTITISAGNTTGTTAFNPTNNSVYEGSETAIIAITGVSGGSATENGTQSQTITIMDSLAAPTVTLSTSASSVAENGSDLTLTATINRQTFEDVTVTLSGTGTSTAGTDYASLSTITISAGNTTGTTAFNPTDDSIYEGSETAIVAITGVSGGDATENGTQSETITITDNETAPTVTLSTSASSVAENGSDLTLTATLSGATSEDVTVTLTGTGTSTAGTDYASLSTITISAGNTTGTTAFNPTDDSIYEGSETAIIAITGVSGGSATESGTQSETITITDNETAPTVTLSTSASSVAENGSDLTITATLSNIADVDVVVVLGTSGSATEGTHYATLSNITISAGSSTGTTSFNPTNDDILGGNKSAVIAISSLSGASATNGSPSSITISIIDDEGTPTVTLSVSDTSVAENGSDLTLTATLSLATAEDVTVTLAGTGTSTAGTDYASLSTITISAGSTTGTTTFNPTDDSVYEGNETAIITITDVSGGSAIINGTQSKTITITENDTAPSLSINDVTASDESAANHTFTVSLSAAAGIAVTVDYATSDGTATAGADYTAISATTLTFAAGETSKTFPVGVLVDNTDEANETVTLTLSNASNASISDATGTLTITDDDAAPSLSINDVTASDESAANHTFTVSLSAPSGKSVTVDYATSDGTATAGADYTAISATTLTFAAGETSKTFPVGVLVDNTDEANETVTLTLSNASNASISDATGTLTITDDDAAPSLSINDVTASDESAANHTFTVSLSAPSGKSVTVDYATSDGTATAGADYTAISATTLTFAAGETSKTFPVGVLVDNTDEANETVTLTLSNASNASISDATGTLTITDDDAAPSLSINDVTASDESAANHTFTVSLSAPSGKSVTVDYATSDGTATAGADYTAISATTLTFAAGETSKTFPVGVLVDNTDEANETVTLTLSNASNASISDATGTLTITDDDAAPSLSINDVTASDESAANHTFTVSLSAPSGKSVTVDYATSDGTATAGADYTAISATTLTFAAGETSKTFPVGVLVDNTDEANETVTLTLSNASNASISDATGTLTITDDDAAPSLSINDVSVAEVYNANTTATFTVSLSAPSGKTVTVNYATSNVTATAGADYTAISATTLTFAAGQTSKTFPVTILNDLSYESSETATVTLSSAGNASLSDSTGTLTITDKALNSGNAPLTSSQEATADATKASTEFSNIEFYDSDKGTNPSPWESINLHKALAYGKYGSGIVVAIMDTGFWFTETGSSETHMDLDGKTITTYGQFDQATYNGTGCSGSNGNNMHGTCVAGIIAADLDNSGIIGVAPEVSLHLTDWGNIVGHTDQYHKMAAGTDNASTAVVQNNSWGYNDVDANDFQGYLDANPSLTTTEVWAAITGSSTLDTVTAYKNSLKSFQSHGVIVFANGNNTSKTSVSFTSALPIWYTDLADEWITVANIDITGTDTKSYTQKGNPCGLAGAFCIATDGWAITAPSHVDGDTHHWSNTQGTSFSAPTVSGAIALMAAHFPNQSPAQWVDRLLASANNEIGFVHVNKVTFGNGVEHGYSNEAGHGILDIYAALLPITSDSYTQVMMHYGTSIQNQNQSYALNQTQMTAMLSLGDSLAKALEGEVTYFYDALDGGFAFDMGQIIRPSLSVVKPSISIDHEIGETKSLKYKKLSFMNSFSENKNRSGYLTFTESEANSTLIGFASNGSWNGYNDASYVFPFLSDIQGGTGINFGNDLGNGYLTLSYNIEGQDGQNAISAKDALTFGYKASPIENVNISYLLGFADENESFLGVKGTGAFDFDGADNKTAFFGLKSDIKLSDKQFISFGFGLSDTVINKNNEGIIQSMSGLTADSFEIGFRTFDTFGSDMLSISISQPSRVSSGSAKLKIAGLANRDGTIPYTYKNVSMEPSGRQLDFAITYNYELNDFSSLRIKMMMTDEKGHDADVDREESVFIGYSRSSLSGNQKFEIGATSSSSNESALKINYNLNW